MFSRARMMARLLVVVGISLSTAGTQYSCSSDGTGTIIDRDLDSGDGPTFSTTIILRDSAGTETYRFARTELIHFELSVRNRTDAVVDVQFPTLSQSAEFIVFKEGGDSARWNSAEDAAAGNAVTTLRFQPRETRIVSISWNQETRDGAFLPAGRFEARGLMRIIGVPAGPLASHELASNLKLFTVN